MDGGALPGALRRPARSRARAARLRARDGAPGGGRDLRLSSGSAVAIAVVALAAAIAILRAVLVPVGSFREGLDELAWGLPADSVVGILGEPNRICASGAVDHLPLTGPDTAALRDALRAATAERWVYTRRGASRPIPHDSDPTCRAPSIATELGFDAAGRLRWYVREMDQTDLVHDPALVKPVTPNR